MPTYEYACKQCGEHLEVVQKFTDEPLTACPACEGPLRKVFGSIGISFKGSGFYKTDSRTDNGSKSKDKDSKEKEPAAASSDTSSSSGADSSKPKADAAAKPDAGKSGAGSSTAAAS